MIVITGTSGHLGRLVVEQLVQRADPAGIVATARSLESIATLADLGVATCALDYDRPDTDRGGARRSDPGAARCRAAKIGRRVTQHTAVIEAAAEAGVEHVAYTSILRADTSPLIAAIEHRSTEEVLARASVTTTRLRHGWYIENYTANLAPALEHGAIIGSAGDGRIAAATRADYAAADAAVLVDPSLRGGTYKLGGKAFTMTEYAASRVRADRSHDPVRRSARGGLPNCPTRRGPARAARRLPRRRGPRYRAGQPTAPSMLDELAETATVDSVPVRRRRSPPTDPRRACDTTANRRRDTAATPGDRAGLTPPTRHPIGRSSDTADTVREPLSCRR